MSTHTIRPKELNQQERMKGKRNSKEGGSLPEAFYGCTVKKQQAYHQKKDERTGILTEALRDQSLHSRQARG